MRHLPQSSQLIRSSTLRRHHSLSEQPHPSTSIFHSAQIVSPQAAVGANIRLPVPVPYLWFECQREGSAEVCRRSTSAGLRPNECFRYFEPLSQHRSGPDTPVAMRFSCPPDVRCPSDLSCTTPLNRAELDGHARCRQKVGRSGTCDVQLSSIRREAPKIGITRISARTGSFRTASEDRS